MAPEQGKTIPDNDPPAKEKSMSQRSFHDVTPISSIRLAD
jgi:hypothetical protein